MGILVIGAVFVDIKGYPLDKYIPGGRNVGRVIHTHGGVCRKILTKESVCPRFRPEEFGLSPVQEE